MFTELSAKLSSITLTADLKAVKITRHMHRREDHLCFFKDIPLPVTARKKIVGHAPEGCVTILVMRNIVTRCLNTCYYKYFG
jgi:hypothetical protein